jgi:uncharacterized membrane protein
MTTKQDEPPTGSSSAVDKAGPKTEGGDVERGASPQTADAGRRWFRYTLPGAWVALVFACLAFTPSLLPRSALLQGVVCGISAAIGYGLGVAGAWTWRAFADRDPARLGRGHGGSSPSRRWPRCWSSLGWGSGGRRSSAT